MILERINNNKDLKMLNMKEKNILAQEIRDYIIEITSKNGGHLASNLGVVELTIALESVFNLPKDKIVWDVGHQSYVHKILNNRKEALKDIRKFNGIAGFPKREEDESDTFNTGHSSTSISAILGIAAARDIKKENYHTIAVIGDGALTGGMALEALNHLGETKKDVIVILNDNEMSISENIGGMNVLLTKLRVKKNYRKSNDRGREIVKSIPVLGESVAHGVARFKNSIKQLIIPGMYFEEIGIRYLGPVDGHNIEDLESILKEAKQIKGPILIHVLTTKGKGYIPAEENPSAFHGTSGFDVETGLSTKKKVKDYSKAFGDKLIEIANRNENVVAITAAMKDGTGLKEFAEKFPDRFFDVGIAEQHAITFAAGLASRGIIPFVPIYSSFYQRCYDQVIHDVAMQNLPVIMCIDRAGLVGNDGETHQGIFDLSFMKIVPNLTIMAPKNYKELEKMMDYAIYIKRPVVIRYPRGIETNNDLKTTRIQLGKSEIIKEGKDLTILSIGNRIDKAIEIKDKLKKLDIEIINIRFLKPLDEKTIINSINKTKNVIVLEDNTIIGGLSSSIKELIIDKKLENINIKSFAYPNKFIKHGSIKEIEKYYKLDTDSMIKEIKKMFR